jgi:hypothetical protein
MYVTRKNIFKIKTVKIMEKKVVSRIYLNPKKGENPNLLPNQIKRILGGRSGDDDDDECYEHLSAGSCSTGTCRCCCEPGCRRRCKNGNKSSN